MSGFMALMGKVGGGAKGAGAAKGASAIPTNTSAPAVPSQGTGTMVGNMVRTAWQNANQDARAVNPQGTVVGNAINKQWGGGDPNGTIVGNAINDLYANHQQNGNTWQNNGAATPVIATPGAIPMMPLYDATGPAQPTNGQNYAEGGPTMPRGVAKIPAFHLPSMGVKVFRPHLMNTSHPHTSTIKPGSSAGANPRAGVGMSMRGMGGGGMRSAPMGAVDNKTGGLPSGGGMPAGIGAGSPAAFAEGGAIPPDPRDPYGRADNVPLTTTAGSYVVPKSVVDRKGSHFFDKIVAEHGSHEDRAAAHLRLQGMPTMQGGGNTPVNVSGGEYVVPRSVVGKLGTHHFDKIVAKEGDHTDRQAAEMRLAGQPSGPGNGPPIPRNQLATAIPRQPLGKAQ